MLILETRRPLRRRHVGTCVLLGVAMMMLADGCDNGERGPSNRPEAGKPHLGTLTERETIAGAPAVLRREMKKACEREDARGEIVYGVRVSPAGQVVLVKALHSTATPQLLNCTLLHVRAWTFPATAEGAAFRFSMTFGPQAQPVVQAATDGIKQSVKRRTSQLQHCYNKALRVSPDMAGKMSYRLLIASSGFVIRVVIEENTGLSEPFVQCTVEAIESWTFPMDGAPDGADLRFSILFSS